MDKCIICQSKEKDDIKYGDFLRKNGVGVHTYCLYLSSNLCQNGKDSEGFLGFLLSDIKKEVKRISMSKCCYCRGYYANIGCCHPKCRQTFHLVCGVKKGAQNEFCDTFRSFCASHVRKVRHRPTQSDVCFICYENLMPSSTRFDPVNMLRAPCCNNGWFHKYCLQKCAKMSGYFFKCPLCNDTEKIKSNLKKMGIFIPDQDAAWELEPGAFQELLERPRTCIAIICKNKSGRNNETDRNPLKICITCGSVAIHENCMQNMKENFQCDECFQIVGSSVLSSSQINDEKCKYEDSDVDVCNINDSDEDNIPLNIKFKNNDEIHSAENQICHSKKELVESDEDEVVIAPKRRNKIHIITDGLSSVTNDKNNDKDYSSSDEEDIITSFISKKNVIYSDSSSSSPEIKRKRHSIRNISSSTSSDSSSESTDPLCRHSLFQSPQIENQLQEHIKYTPSVQQVNLDNYRESHKKYIVSSLQPTNKCVGKNSNKSSYLTEITQHSDNVKNVEHNFGRLTQTSVDYTKNKENIQHKQNNFNNPTCLQENELNFTPTKPNYIDNQTYNFSTNKTELTSNQKNLSGTNRVSEVKNVTVRLRRVLDSIQNPDISKENNSSSYFSLINIKNNDSSKNNINNIANQTVNTVRRSRRKSVCAERESNFKDTNLDSDKICRKKSIDNAVYNLKQDSKQNTKVEEVYKYIENSSEDNQFNLNCEKRRTRLSSTQNVPKQQDDDNEFYIFHTSCIANRTRRKSDIKNKLHSQNSDEFTPSNSTNIKKHSFPLSETESLQHSETDHFSLKLYKVKLEEYSKNKLLYDRKMKHNENITTERAVHLQYYTELDAYKLPKKM